MNLNLSDRRTNEIEVPSADWLTTIYKFGVPSAIAIYLVYLLGTKVNDNLININRTLEAHVVDMQRNIDQNQKIYYLLQTICVNSAKTNYDRNQCFK